jgi:hypothetical protein
MMDVTMKLSSPRPKGKAICSSSVITLLFLLATRFSQLDAYTVHVSHTHTRAATTTQHCSLKCEPARLIRKHARNDQRFFVLNADERGSSNDSPKKKRRRKQPASADATSAEVQRRSVLDEELNDTSTMNDIDLTMMNEIARYEFENKIDAPTLTALPNVVDDTINLLEPQQSTASAAASTVSGAIPLPDIKEARKRKQMEEENARIQQEQDEQKVKIKRTDKEAFRRVSRFLIQSILRKYIIGSCLANLNL